MPISDKKKVQSLLNKMGQRAVEMQEIGTELLAFRQAYLDQAVDPTGTPLAGNVTAASAWIDSVVSVANDAVANGFISNIVMTHKNNALGVI